MTKERNLLSQFAKKNAGEAHVSDVTNHTLHNKQVSWYWSEFSLWGPPTLIFHISHQYLSPKFCGSCKHTVRLLCGNRFSLTGSAFFLFFFFFFWRTIVHNLRHAAACRYYALFHFSARAVSRFHALSVALRARHGTSGGASWFHHSQQEKESLRRQLSITPRSWLE